VLKAYSDGERSSSPAGLSHYWIIKSTLVIGLAMLFAASLARLHRCLRCLRETPAEPASGAESGNGG
jgi:TRAP-type mannitol/chloroaromatic compound transport system permease small subunit